MQRPKKIMTHKAPRDIMGVTTQPKRRSNMCHYTHFTIEEQELSRVLKAQGFSIRAIARMLNRSPSSVSREFRRNCYANGTYAAHHADKLYKKRRKNRWQTRQNFPYRANKRASCRRGKPYSFRTYGKEFAAHQELAEAKDVKAYFCEPYSPWH